MFFDYILVNLEDGHLIDERQFNKMITNKPTVFCGIKPTLEFEVLTKNEDEKKLEPFLQWNYSEIIIFVWLITMFIGVITLIFEYYNFYSFNRHDEGSLFRSLMDIFTITPLGFVLLTFIIYLYKYKIKKYFLHLFMIYYYYYYC